MIVDTNYFVVITPLSGPFLDHMKYSLSSRACGWVLVLCLIAGPVAHAQRPLPVLRTTQPTLSIREGQSLYRDIWGVSSAVKPDVFTTQPFTGKKRLVFYSDVDSLVLWVRPQKTYDFVVLVNGRDSAYTRISTQRGQRPTLVPKLVFTRVRAGRSGPDTIGFRLDQNFGIHVPGKVNNSAPVDFLFDTGAGAVVLAQALVNQRVPLRQDGHTVNVGADGRRAVATSSGNMLAVGGLRWPAVSLLTIDYSGLGFDGVLGWVAFENKIVEVDYEKRYLVIHDQLPATVADYSPVELQLRQGIPFIKASLTAKGPPREGWFDLDTGSDGGLVVSQEFAARHDLTNGLKRLGTAAASGSTGGVVPQTIFALPKLKIGDYELYQVPLYVNDQDPVGGASAENIGSLVLKRFNLLLDFRQYRAYLKPNQYWYSPIEREATK